MVSDIAIVAAIGAFLVTQVHLVKVARRLIKRSKESWDEARTTIRLSFAKVQEQIDKIPAIVKAEVEKVKIDLPEGLDSVSQKLDDLPPVLQGAIDTSTKALSANVAGNLDDAVHSIQAQILQVESKLTGRRGFAAPGADPSAAQEKGTESKHVNHIVDVLDGATGGANWTQRARNLSGLLQELGDESASDWLDEHPDAIAKIEKRVRANPNLAARLQKLEARMAGGQQAAAQGGGTVTIDSSGPGVRR